MSITAALSLFLSGLLFMLCMFLSVYRTTKNKKVTLLEWSILGIGLIYGVGWLTVLGFTSVGYNSFWADRLLAYEDYYIVHNALVFVLLSCVIFGWFLSKRLYNIGFAISTKHLSFDVKRMAIYAWILFVLSFFLRWLYVREFGGFIEYLDYSSAIRSSLSEINNPWSFLQPFGMVAVFAALLFFSLLVGRERVALSRTGFVLSLTFAVYVLFSLLGRMGFVMTLAIGGLAFAHMRGLSAKRLIIGAPAAACGFIVLVYVISEALSIKGADSVPDFMARELSFPFVSFFAQIDQGEHLYRWYKDFLFAPLHFLPSSWWSQWIDDVSQVNTAVIMGAPKGQHGVTGGIPVDLLTLGLMQSSVFGVVVVGIAFGGMIRFLQAVSDGVQLAGLRAIIYSYFSVRVATYAIAYAHPSHLVSGIFGIVFCLFLMSILLKTSKVRISPGR